MKLYVVAKTSIKDLVIDFIEIVNEKGQTISLNWEESSVERVKDGFESCYEHVVSGEDEIFNIDDLLEMRVVGIGLYSDTKKILDIDIKEMGFVDDAYGRYLSFHKRSCRALQEIGVRCVCSKGER